MREFDLAAKAFVEGGFALAEAKGGGSWAGPDEVFVVTDFGPVTMTECGYPRTVRLWRLGQPFEDMARRGRLGSPTAGRACLAPWRTV